jgi:hypothetical protein
MYLDVTGQIIAAVLGAAVLLLVLLQALSVARLRRACQALQRDTTALQNELGALCTGASGMGAHLGRLDQQLLRLNERQDHLESHDSLHREYDRAVKLVRNGAGAEEIMAQCNLLRTEAELLLRLHGGTRDARRAPA